MKRHAPATERNREPIAAVLGEELPPSGMALEVASGSGEHAVHFAGAFPHLLWQPTDADPEAVASIEAWRAQAGLLNLRKALTLDAAAAEWPIECADAVVCINMAHISPPAATRGLFAGADRLLRRGAPLVLYGPFLEAEVETAPSNIAFDADLRARDASWGLRDVAWLDGIAEANGFGRTRRVGMPANNLMLVYRKK